MPAGRNLAARYDLTGDFVGVTSLAPDNDYAGERPAPGGLEYVTVRVAAAWTDPPSDGPDERLASRSAMVNEKAEEIQPPLFSRWRHRGRISNACAGQGDRTLRDAPTIWTLDWVPEPPRGFVRDLRLRWAAEEAGLPYAIATVPFEGRETNHLDKQPFGQVPILIDGETILFESGACLLHLARKSDVLMPRDPIGEGETLQWVIAALNSIEIVTVPWWFLKMSGDADNALTDWMDGRLAQIERVFNEREWLAANRFTVADLLMADVLRIPDLRAHGDRPATEAYIRRLTSRPAFRKAHADQLAHFAQADRKRASAQDA